jgi:putative membrane protein
VTESPVKSFLSIAARGFLMGAADVVPGVSGGTMAVVLGIYQRLINAIGAVDTRFVKHLLRAQLRAAAEHADLRFLLALGFGIFAALMFFTRVVSLPTLIKTHPEPVYGLFFGLITASIVILLKSLRGFGGADALILILGVGIGFGMVNLVPTATPESAWFIFLSGALAICAMILPGISGSFILLILQKYAYIFTAVGRLDLAVLLPFALGAATGLVLFSRVLAFLLSSFYRLTVNFIVGLLIGSLWVIWPFQIRVEVVIDGTTRLLRNTPFLPHSLSPDVLSSIALAGIGVVGVLALHRAAAARGLPDHV